MQLTITRKIGLVLLLPVSGALFSLWIFFGFLSQTATEASTINMAGRQRMLSESLLHHAQRVVVGGEVERPELWQMIGHFDSSLKTLVKGAQATGQALWPASPQVRVEIDRVNQLWQPHRKALVLIAEQSGASPEVMKAFEQVKSRTRAVTQASDRVVTALELHSKRLRKRLLTILIWIAGLDIFLLLAGIIVTRGYVAERRQAELQNEAHIKLLEQLSGLSLTLAGEPEEVFERIVRLIGELLEVRVVCLSAIEGDELHFLAVFADGKVKTDVGRCPLSITPCSTVEQTKDMRFYDQVMERFPEATFLKDHDAYSYCGFPSLDRDGNVIAVTCLLDDKPREFSVQDQHLLKILGQRIAVEMERQRHKEEQGQVQTEMRKLSLGIEQTADLVVITDADGVVEYVNPAFETVTGFSREEVMGGKPGIIKSGKQSESFYRRLWNTILGGQTFRGVFTNRRKDGTLYHEEKTITPLTDANGKITQFISTGKDVTDRVHAQQQADYLAYYDSLTGLPNRVLARERFDHALTKAHRQENLNALMYLDLDNFKAINDSFGHGVGDQLLRAVADRLNRCIREGDTVARIGGDEFVVILEDIGHVDDSTLVAEKLIKSCINPFELSGHTLYTTLSIGIALYPLDDNNFDGLLKYADTAMYRSKDLGGNQAQYYTNDMTVRVSRRLAMETSLREALARNEFLLYYQPKVDLSNGEIIGMEALLRWERPGSGLVGPMDFVPLLEETGLIVPVGEWVLRTACAQTKAWHGADFKQLRVAVNISTHQFRQKNFTQLVANILTETGLEPRYLELELTESVLMEDTAAISATLHELSLMGVGFALDDFGTGYSSLGYLRRFPIDELKIDRSFISDITTNPDDAAIAKAVIEMARALKLRVVAEGVETEEQAAFLLEHGCDQMQGYYYSPPLPAEGFTWFLREGYSRVFLR